MLYQIALHIYARSLAWHKGVGIIERLDAIDCMTNACHFGQSFYIRSLMVYERRCQRLGGFEVVKEKRLLTPKPRSSPTCIAQQDAPSPASLPPGFPQTSRTASAIRLSDD